MKLYGYYRSSTTYRLRIALELKGLHYEYIPIDLLKNEQKSESFVNRNPFGSLPMLETEGYDRAQSMAQIEWLEETFPSPPLLPKSINDRYLARELAYSIATETHAVNNLPVLRYLKNPLGHSQSEIGTWYRHWLSRTLDPLEKRLNYLNSGDFLFGSPGLFEVVLLPQFYNAERFDFDFSDKPRIMQIAKACLALPEFQHAHPDNQIDNPEYES